MGWKIFSIKSSLFKLCHSVVFDILMYISGGWNKCLMFCWFIFQGTMAVELLEQVPDLDAILVSASGGGMISGISIAAKSIKKDIKG